MGGVRKRNGARWRTLQARVRARGDACGICGEPIDYSLPPLHPMSFEVDHIVPISRGGAEYDPDNCQASHRICNQRKGDGAKPDVRAGKDGAPLFPTSRDW